MIIVLTTAAHDYTHRVFDRTGRFELRRMSYGRALTQKRLPRATYLFTDLDRLNFWELELAARLYRQLADAGLRALNDPARVRLRYSLLRKLKDEGRNTFDVWRLEDTRRPAASDYPVFLRTESAHRGNLTDLIETPEALEQAIETALASGMPRRELLIVQFCGEALRPGLFVKQAAFRIGDRFITAPQVMEGHWTAKYGAKGLATQEDFEDDHRAVLGNRYGDSLRGVFDSGCVEYGRVDFSIVRHQPQVYEINTNPHYSPNLTADNPLRVAALRCCRQAQIDAFAAIDGPASGRRVTIGGWQLEAQRGHDRWLLQTRWTP